MDNEDFKETFSQISDNEQTKECEETALEEICIEENIDECSQEDELGQIVDAPTFKKTLDKGKEFTKNKRTLQKKLWSFVFIVLNVVIVAVILLGMLEKDSYTPLTNLEINNTWIIVSILCFFGLMFTEQLRFIILIKKSTRSMRPNLAYKVSAMGRYYDCITPLSTGGQPFQAYYLTQRGVKASHAVSIPVAKFILQQIVFTIMSLIVLILAYTKFNHLMPSGVGADFVEIACWIGFIGCFVVVFSCLFLSIGSFGKKIVLGILKLLNKIKLVKNYDQAYEKLLKIVEEYQRTIKFYIKSPIMLLEMIFVSLAYFLLLYTIPYVIYLGFGGAPDVMVWLKIFFGSLMVDLAAGFIPLPGGSGVAELSFTAMFTASFGGASFWALLLWRAVTYYGFVVQGLLMILYDAFIGNRKNRKHLVLLKQKFPYYSDKSIECELCEEMGMLDDRKSSNQDMVNIKDDNDKSDDIGDLDKQYLQNEKKKEIDSCSEN